MANTLHSSNVMWTYTVYLKNVCKFYVYQESWLETNMKLHSNKENSEGMSSDC